MECPICLDIFDTSIHMPYVLPCGHSVCVSCVDALIKAHNNFCPSDRREFTSRDQLKPNYDLIEALQGQITPGAEDLLCCNGHKIEELISVTQNCEICDKRRASLWFCITCQYGVCDKCKSWFDGSRSVNEPGLKCYRSHPMRLTDDVQKFYPKRKGIFLCDGCLKKSAGSSSHCRKCNVDFCIECYQRLIELIPIATNIFCTCKNQLVWRFSEMCGKCKRCKNVYKKSGSFICLKCKNKFCIKCADCIRKSR